MSNDEKHEYVPGQPAMTFNQFSTWVISQAVRNNLEAFHGGGAVDPEDPDSEEGFITDKQMRALNIVIRHTIHEALCKIDSDPDEFVPYVSFQINTSHMAPDGYMEAPGSPELESAFSPSSTSTSGRASVGMKPCTKAL
jgi:hypothetical protein